jgi:small subunit ribosomal protein S7
MGRKTEAVKRPCTNDGKYGSQVVEKFIRRMMIQGKKSTSARVVYLAMTELKEKTGKDELEVFVKALDNVKPLVEVKSRRVGGATYQVPVEIKENRREALAMRWVINSARARSGKSMGEKLSAELLDAFNSQGAAFKKKEDTHRMAEANKAFSHYKW